MRILFLVLATASAGTAAELTEVAPQSLCRAGGFSAIRFNGTETRGKADARFNVFVDAANYQGRGFDAALRSAMAAWTGVPGARWSYSFSGFSPAPASSSDGEMTVVRGGASFGSGVLASTIITAQISTGHILDSDVFFNPEIRFATAQSQGEFDFESVALHELGHGLGLDHNDACSAARTVMYPTISVGAQVRSLFGPEVEGVRYLYPAAGGGPGGGVVTASPPSLSFTAMAGAAAPVSQTIGLSGGGGTAWSASPSTTSGGNWLRVDPQEGTLPSVLTVSVSTSGLATGFFAGRVTVRAGETEREVAVSLNLTGPPPSRMELSPTSLGFASITSAAAPVGQNVRLTGTTGLAWSATASAEGGNWLRPVPSTGTLPASMTVFASPSALSPGVYRGQIAVTAGGITREAVVMLEVAAHPRIVLEPSTVSLVGLTGNAMPVCASVRILGFADTTLEWTARSGAGWLTVSPSLGRSPSTVGICASAVGLAPGEYSAGVSVSVAGPAVGEGVPVSFSVRPPVAVSEGGVLNAASLAPGQPIAPGAILSVFGTNLAVKTESAPGFPLPAELGGARAQIGGMTARLLYASPGQLNLVVPGQLVDMAGSTTTVTVYQDRLASLPARVRVAAAAPGAFTLLGHGAGAGAVTHADGRVVSRREPGTGGETVLVYVTGLGRLEPPVGDGEAAPAEPLSRAAEPVRVWVDAELAKVEFAGAAPGFSGLQVVAATLPANLGRRYPEMAVEAGGVMSNRFTAGGPSLQEVSPRTARAGVEAEVTLRGLYLPETSVVQAGGLRIPAVVDAGGRSLRVTLPAAVLPAPGTLALTVADAEAPGELASNPVFLTIER